MDVVWRPAEGVPKPLHSMTKNAVAAARTAGEEGSGANPG